MPSRNLAHGAIVIRQETGDDIDAIREVVAAAFALAEHSAPPTSPGGPPGEVDLLDALRGDAGWLPALALVATADHRVVGHVVCTRAHIDGAPTLGLGPLSVLPDRQREGIGGALMREVLARAEQSGESVVALLGDPAYYRRFGFAPGHALGVRSPEAAWGDHFQARHLGAGPHPVGHFAYAEPFNDL